MTDDHGFHSPEGRKEETQSGPRFILLGHAPKHSYMWYTFDQHEIKSNRAGSRRLQCQPSTERRAASRIRLSQQP